jgi:hypothetical protein
MKSLKRGPAPPVVRGLLATLRGLRLTFCSRRRSDLFTPRARLSPGAFRGIPRPRPPSRVHAPTCSPLQQLDVPPDPLEQTPLPARSAASPARGRPRVSTLRPAHPCTSSVFNYRALLFPGQPPTMIYWNQPMEGLER